MLIEQRIGWNPQSGRGNEAARICEHAPRFEVLLDGSGPFNIYENSHVFYLIQRIYIAPTVYAIIYRTKPPLFNTKVGIPAETNCPAKVARDHS